jgi:hypothetical protein
LKDERVKSIGSSADLERERREKREEREKREKREKKKSHGSSISPPGKKS